MTQPIDSPDFGQAEANLEKLFTEVTTQQGFLSGGTQLSLGAANIKELMETKISLGNPRDRLVKLKEETLKLDNSDIYDFYYTTITVALIPKPATRFWRLTLELDFGPKGEGEPIIQKIFPTQQWRSVMTFGVGMDIGLDANLDWTAAVDSSQLPFVSQSLQGELKAKVESKTDFNGFLAIPSFKYELGNPQITATGENNSFCYWRIEDQQIQKIGTAKFAIVFKVPKGVDSITLTGKAWAEVDMNWLTADIKDVVGALSDSLKGILRQGNQGANQLSKGIAEEWQLQLPRLEVIGEPMQLCKQPITNQGAELIAALRGKATRNLTTDDIMQLTRADP